MTEPLKTLETVTCTRCGGTGNYSYCQMYGSRCFKCHGSGKQYTKRGHAAALYLESLRRRKGADVKVGDWIKMYGIAGFSKTTFYKVETIACTFAPGYSNHGQLEFHGVSAKGETMGYHTGPDGDVPLGFGKAEKMAQYAKAVEYQNTLTKAGTPRKR